MISTRRTSIFSDGSFPTSRTGQRASGAVARLLTLTLALLGLTAGAALAGTDARVYGKISNAEGDPIPEAVITVTTEEQATFNEQWKVNKKGRYNGYLADASFVYTLTIQAEGYKTLVQPLKVEFEATERRDFTLEAGSDDAVPTTTSDPGGGEISTTSTAIALYNEGAQALRSGDFTTAQEKLEKALKEDPELAPAHGVMALALVQQKDYQGALASAEKALELRPGEPNALQARYDAYRGLGDKENAEAAGEALAAAGQNADAAKQVFNEGAALTREGDTAGALEKFEEAARLDPSLSAAHEALAGLYFAAERYEDAVAAAERTLEGNPGSLKALQIRAEAYRKLGDEEGTLKALAALAAADPATGVEAIYNLGVAAFNAGNSALAIQAFEQTVAVDPSYASAYYSLGLTYVNQGENAKAKEAFAKFVELDPDNPDAATAKEMIQYLN